MLRLIFCLIFFICAEFSSADIADSLQQHIANNSKLLQKDSTLASYYMALIDACRDEDPFRGLTVAVEGKQKAIEAGDRKGLAGIFNKEGNIFLDLGLHASAVTSYYQCLLINVRLGDWCAVAYAHNDIGYVYQQRDLAKLALEHYRKAVTCVWADTAATSQEALAHTYNNMAFAFEFINLTDSAYRYFQKALHVRRRIGNTLKIAQSLAYAGRFATMQKRYIAADQYLNEAIALDRKVNHHHYEAYAWIYKGDNALAQNHPQASVQCYRQAFALLGKTNMVREKIRSQIKLAQALMQSGAFDDSYEQALQALRLARKYSYYPEEQKVLHHLILFTKQYGTLQQVINYQQQWIDSKLNEKRDLALSTIQQLESNEAVQNSRLNQLLQYKNAQIRLMEKRTNSQTRQLLIALLVFIVLLTIILLATINFRRKTEESLKKLQKENLLLQQESEKYYTTIINKLEEPVSKHNQLITALSGKNNLFSETEILHAVKSSESIIKSAELPLLNVLYWARFKSAEAEAQSDVPLRITAEQAIQVNLQELEQEYIHLTNDLDPGMKVKIPKGALQLIFRNLLDNALAHSGRGSSVRLSAREKGRMIEVSIRDNGKGIPKHLADAFDISATGHDVFEGMGLQVSKLICIKSGGDLWMESEEGKGTTIYFTLFNATQ